MQRRNSLILDTTNPVDWSHPLNKSRVVWWYAPRVSGHFGGTFRDLCKRNDGYSWSPLSVNRWRKQISHPEYGASFVSAVDNFGYSCPVGFAGPQWNWTLAFTITKFEGWAGTFGIFGHSSGDSVGYVSTIESSAFRLLMPGVSWATSYNVNGVLSLGVAYRCMFVGTNVGGNKIQLYINGLLVQETTGVANPGIPTSSSLVALGYQPSVGRYATNSIISNCSLWWKSLSPSEVSEEYRLSQVGYQTNNSPLRFFRARFPTIEITQNRLLSLRRRVMI